MLIKMLEGILINEHERKKILQLTGDSAILVIECFDKVSVDEPHSRSRVLITLQVLLPILRKNPNQAAYTVSLSTFSRLSVGCQYLPRSCWIDPGTITLPNEPHRSGTRAEIYCGTWNGESVAVKVLRTSKQESSTKLEEVSAGRTVKAAHGHGLNQREQRFRREAVIWYSMCLIRGNLKFKGVFYHNGVPAIVTPWMPTGNITEYLGENPNANRLKLASSSVLPVFGIGSLCVLSCLAFGRSRRGLGPPFLRDSAWGH